MSNKGFATALVGVAAAAVAGFMLYRSSTARKPTEKSPTGERVATEAAEEGELVDLPTYLFIDPNASQSEKDTQINHWVQEQVEALLSQNEDGQLVAVKQCLSKDDFEVVSIIVENKVKVALFETKVTLSAERKAMVDSEQFNSESYLDKLIEHITDLEERRENSSLEVLEKLKLSADVFEVSFEEHVGTEEDLTAEFIQANLTQFFIHPIENGVSKTEEEAIALYKQIMDETITRISQEDAMGKFESITLYLRSLDLISVDIAASKGLSEADFRALVLSNAGSTKLVEDQKALCVTIYDEIEKQLNHGEEVQKQKTQDLQRKLTEKFQQEEADRQKKAEEEAQAKAEEEAKAAAEQPAETAETKAEEPAAKEEDAKDEDDFGVDAALEDLSSSQQNFKLGRAQSKEFVQSVIKASPAKATEDAADDKKLKVSINDFTFSASSDASQKFSVLVQVRESSQYFQTGEQAMNEDGKIAWTESHEFEKQETLGTVILTLQDENEEAFSSAQELAVEELIKSGSLTVEWKSLDKSAKLGDLSLSGEWVDIVKN